MNNERLMVMRNKIENVGLEDCGVDGGLVAEIIDELIDSRYKIATLTSERDEARKELAELRSAPGMEEVDAILNDVNSSVFANQERLSNIARRAIASRDEVVGLLDHILSCIITVRQENTPEWMEYIVEEVNKVNKAMGDSDRVELSRGDIVIVKGGSEIVEGNHA